MSPTNGTFALDAVPLASGANALTVTVTDVSGNTSTQAVTVTNLSVFGVSPTYDANGNLTALVQPGVTHTFEWDAANQLTSAADNGVEVLRCWYDGEGRRIAKSEVVNGQTNKLQYVYEGKTIIAVLNETGALLEYYTRGLGVGGDIGTIVAATHTTNSWTNGTFYVHNNHRGDVTTVRSGSATVASYDYTAFGETRSASGSYTPRFRFSSKELDAASGFYYFGFRFYESVTGRWLSNDPIGIAGGLNQYVFCADNPMNFVDPWGLEVLVQWHKVLGNNYHSLIRITPGNQARYANDPRFNNVDANRNRYATLGAGPVLNRLVSSPNRPTDIVPHQGGNVVNRPNGCNGEDAFIDRLFALDGNYADNLDYDLSPANPADRRWYVADDGYNSNSYVSGLLGAAGGTVAAPGANTPGWTRPIPPELFQPQP